MPKTMTAQEVFAANCSRLREAAGLTQTELAARATQFRKPRSAANATAAINQRTIGRIEKPNGNPTMEIIEAVASALGVTPWQLLTPENVSHLKRGDLPHKAQKIIEILANLNDDGLTAILVQTEFVSANAKYTTGKRPRSSI